MFKQQATFEIEDNNPIIVVQHFNNNKVVAECIHRFNCLEGQDSMEFHHIHAWRKAFGMSLSQFYSGGK